MKKPLGALPADEIALLKLEPFTPQKAASLFTQLYTSQDPIIGYVRYAGYENILIHGHVPIRSFWYFNRDWTLLKELKDFGTNLETTPFKNSGYNDFLHDIQKRELARGFFSYFDMNPSTKTACTMRGAFYKNYNIDGIEIPLVSACLNLAGAIWTTPHDPTTETFLKDLLHYKIMYA